VSGTLNIICITAVSATAFDADLEAIGLATWHPITQERLRIKGERSIRGVTRRKCLGETSEACLHLNRSSKLLENVMHYILACMVIGTVFGAGLAIATEQTPTPAASPASGSQRHLAKFDEQFKAADMDNDGGLTKAEAQSAGMERIVNHFDRLDMNKNGKVTREEIRALLRSRLSS
jgi:hypothetical protein